MKFIVKMGDRRFRDRLMKDAASVMPITAEEFDANPFLINCLNGTYDMEKMEFREHDWRDFLTMQTNFDYTLQDSRCERWERFITEVTCNDPDKAEYLQKALGYSMGKNDKFKELYKAIGVLAETGILFYRATIQAGATPGEARLLTQAFLRASMQGDDTPEPESEEEA